LQISKRIVKVIDNTILLSVLVAIADIY